MRSVSDRGEHPRQLDRLPDNRRRLPAGHREPREAQKRRRGRPPASSTGADPVPTILPREERNGARSAAPVPHTAAARCRRTRPGPSSPHRQARGPCPPRDPAIVLFLKECAVGRSTFLTCGHDPWITFVPGVRQPVAAARMTLTATAGRVISITNAASSRPGPRRRRSGPSRCAGVIRRSPGPQGSGRSACSAAGPAQRHGGETPEAWVPASRTPLRRPSPSPEAGGLGKQGEHRLLG